MRQEDRFTPLHNNVLEALIQYHLSSYEWQVLLSIIRKTYGYVDTSGKRKRMDWISNSQISAMTGIPRPHVSRAIGKLIKRGFLKKTGIQIGLDKNFYKLPKQVIIEPPKITQTGNGKLPKQVILELPNQVPSVTNIGISKLPIQVHTKDSITKETNTKDILQKQKKDGQDFRPPNSANPDEAKTPFQKVMKAYRIKRFPEIQELEGDDKIRAIVKWNKLNIPKMSKYAKELLDHFENYKTVIECIDDVGTHLDKLAEQENYNGSGWTLAAISRNASGWEQNKNKKEED